jgi:hypothetical protein
VRHKCEQLTSVFAGLPMLWQLVLYRVSHTQTHTHTYTHTHRHQGNYPVATAFLTSCLSSVSPLPPTPPNFYNLKDACETMPYFIILRTNRTVGSQNVLQLISDRNVAIVMHQFFLEISRRVLLNLTGTLMCVDGKSHGFMCCAQKRVPTKRSGNET